MGFRLTWTKPNEIGISGKNTTINKNNLLAIAEDIKLDRSKIEKFDCKSIDKSGIRYKLELIYSISDTH